MFDCLKEKVEKKKVVVCIGMEVIIEKVRFKELRNEKKKKVNLYLPAKIVSTKHKNFYVLKIKSNYDNISYFETINKDEFHNKLTSNFTLKL